jgi:accessory gene regulator B
LLERELGLDENSTAVVKYSLTVYLTSIIGYIAIVLAAWPLGVVKPALASVITASLLRIFSGGAHASCSRNCVLAGAIIFPLLGLGAGYFTPSSIYLLYGMVTLAGLWAAWAVYRYAPADTPGKPISTVQQRNKLRRWSFGIIILWFLWAFSLLTGITGVTYKTLVASALGIMWQGFSLTPPGYYLVDRFDRMLGNT